MLPWQPKYSYGHEDLSALASAKRGQNCLSRITNPSGCGPALRDEAHARAVAEDLEQLDKLRRYLIFRRKVAVPGRELIDAIDDYLEKLTGDRRTLHAGSSSIG